MKIAISMLSGIGYGGVTYFSRFIPALAKVDKHNEYHVFIHSGNDLPKTINQKNFIFYEYPSSVRSLFMRHFSEQFILPIELRRKKIDIMFTAKNVSIIFAPCKTIISIQNMEPLCYKNYKNNWLLDILSWLRKMLTFISIKRAGRIIAASQFVKGYLENLRPGIGDKVNVIYNGNPVSKKSLNKKHYGGKHSFVLPASKFVYKNQLKLNLNKSHSGDKHSFILSASKFVAYANQVNLIEGYAELYEKNKELPPLWFAGGIHDKTYFNKIKKVINERNLNDKIVFLGLIPHRQLVELYSQADAFIFPSTLEACPQTPIEAMACGVPIASSNISPMPEICETAAVYFDPYDKNDIAEKLDLVLFDEDLRKYLKKESLERIRFFDWEKIAVEHIRIFEMVKADPHQL